MGIEKLIEELNDFNENHIAVLCGSGQCACGYLCDKDDCIVVQAAAAITDLLARAEAAEARAQTAERALARMWYAYENKDAECPHEYEIAAVREAEKILGKWEDVMQKIVEEEWWAS